MPDLATTYLGLRLRNPILLGASPLTMRVESVQALEAAGVGGVVMHSLFEEAIEHAQQELARTLERGADSHAEAQGYLPAVDHEWPSPDAYMQHLAEVKKSVRIPVIASLNGTSEGGWLDYAKRCQDAGADALELNVYYLVADPRRDSGEIEDDYLKLVAAVRRQINIPLAVKIGPYFTGLAAFARRLSDSGADGIVLFNRFYQADFDLQALEPVPHLRLSNSEDLMVPLRWCSILCGKTSADLCVTGGVHTSEDAVKALLAGARAVQVAAAFMQHGPAHAARLVAGLNGWLQEREYQSVAQLCGSMSHSAVADPSAIERANYLKALRSYSDHLLR